MFIFSLWRAKRNKEIYDEEKKKHYIPTYIQKGVFIFQYDFSYIATLVHLGQYKYACLISDQSRVSSSLPGPVLTAQGWGRLALGPWDSVLVSNGIWWWTSFILIACSPPSFKACQMPCSHKGLAWILGRTSCLFCFCFFIIFCLRILYIHTTLKNKGFGKMKGISGWSKAAKALVCQQFRLHFIFFEISVLL